MTKKDFTEWLLEEDAYGSRSERFHDLLKHYGVGDNIGLTANLLLWLESAYVAGGKSDSE
jgi:hypothetical protein